MFDPDLSVFGKARSIRDYDKQALDEARQMFLEAQKMDVVRRGVDIDQQKVDMQRKFLEQGLPSGGGVDATLYRNYIAAGGDPADFMRMRYTKPMTDAAGNIIAVGPEQMGLHIPNMRSPQVPNGTPAPARQSPEIDNLASPGVGQPPANDIMDVLSRATGGQVPNVAPQDMPANPAQMQAGLGAMGNPNVIAPAALKPDQVRELAQGLNKQGDSLRSYLDQLNNVGGAIKEAQNNAGWWNTGWRNQILGGVGDTDAYNLNQTLETIKSNIGFDKLQEMRQNSPTGGALGAVSDRENSLLQSTIRSVDAAQSEGQLRANLDKLSTQLDLSRKRITEAYLRDLKQFGPQAMVNVDPPDWLKEELTRQASGSADSAPPIPQEAIQMLQQDPRLQDQFDQKYGQGAAIRILRGN